jgi:transcriptional regulator with XRE-family HTH domain
VSTLDLVGMLRRIRRLADLSQRELARRIEVSKSTVAAAEGGSCGMDARVLARAAALAGLRLVLVDEQGREVGGMSGEAVRDMGGRLFPAHLDTRHGDEAWWYDAHRYGRDHPWYTFDRARRTRDEWRRRTGTPDDHQLPAAGDAPAERVAARRRAAAERAAEERQRLFESGALRAVDQPFDCDCPPSCDELDDRSGKPVHAPECPCDCDVG